MVITAAAIKGYAENVKNESTGQREYMFEHKMV